MSLHLRIILGWKFLNSYGFKEAVAGFLLLNSLMKGLVMSNDSDALTIP